MMPEHRDVQTDRQTCVCVRLSLPIHKVKDICAEVNIQVAIQKNPEEPCALEERHTD